MAFTTGQAGAQTQQLANVPAAYTSDAQELARAQRLAQMLSSAEPAQGQMVSGRYVAPSWTQNLAQLVQAGTGAYFADQAEKQNIALANKIREGQNVAIADYMGDLQGRPATQKQTELAGPYGQAGEDGANVPQPMATRDIAATPANPMLANLNASRNDMLPDWMRQHAIKEVTKGPKYKEISQYNEKTGNTENYRYDENSPNPTSTMQFLGVSKPAISLSDRLNLTDKGIAIPNNYGGGSPAVGGGSAPVGGNAPVGGGGVPMVGNQPTVKPVSATTASTQDLVNTYGYDPFKPPPMPKQSSPAAARSWQDNATKPLEGTAGQKVDGAKMYYNALEKYNSYVAGLKTSDLADPSVRQRLSSLYATAKLTGKEANNLGVLNGGDEKILEEVLPNYKDIFVTQKNLKKIVQEQKEFASGIIVEAYGTQQKAVPENMRRFVVVPKAEEPVAQVSTPKQNNITAKAILNGEQIEVRNGKWVNSKTGKAVQ
jgi:hypothetical protein